MPPHTISPTPTSQGLGISFSSLSPPPPSQALQPKQSTGFTGMGVGPRSSAPAQPPSPTRVNPRQPTFALRPTHTRQASSKGFNSFSAIPPPVAGTGGPSSPRRLPPPPGSEATSESGKWSMHDESRRPSRADSAASTGTNASRYPRKSKSVDLLRRFSKADTVSGGKYVPLSGQDDLDHDPDPSSSIGSVALLVASPVEETPHRSQVQMDSLYAPEETHSQMDHTSPAPSVRPLPRQPSSSGRRPLPRQPSSSTSTYHAPPPVSPPRQRAPSRNSVVSSSAATPPQSQAHSPGNNSTSSETHLTHLSMPQGRTFPLPPNHPPRSQTTYSDPSEQASSHLKSHPTAYFMPRSHSQPLSLHAVPESDREFGLSAGSHQNQRDAINLRRISNISTGIHSKNAALLNAESGGMMLTFSPSGDGVWREGAMIGGADTGNSTTPQSAPIGRMQTAEDPEEPLKSRPWSESTFSQHQHQLPPPMLRQHGRSHSDGSAILARQGTLFFPSGSSQRASDELGIMLGGRSRRLSQSKLLSPPDLGGWEQAGGATEKVKLEASKKKKARVEVDVVLERECVVEGGEVRGRMEVRVTGGKRSEGLRIGGGKVRVIGFEEIGTSSRHIFYHHHHSLPLFANPPLPNGPKSSLFASPPDEEGYHLAAEGSHSVPFQLRLPLDGGAKGSYTSQNAKGPCVRYVVVGSVKIHVPSTGKRSIAHFYRSIVVLPYLNPALVLAPSQDVIEARVEKGLGWILGGEKGRVEVRVALGRRSWVSGQRIWFQIGISNESTRKIKTLNVALLQTVQTFNPQPLLELQQKRNNRLSRSSTAPIFGVDDVSTPEIDACQTTTTRRKVAEEVLEADFAEKGAGRVTGKGWWTGVDAGESGHWDLSLLAPSGMISIRRTRLVEVLYNLRVTVNGSIYVDIPVTLINFLSIDPPPMPGDGPRLATPVSVPIDAATHTGELTVVIGQGPYAQRKGPSRMQSSETMQSFNPAKASSTTLHLDALLQAGRARAEAEGQGTERAIAHTQKARPLSMNSDYETVEGGTPLAPLTATAPPQPQRPRPGRVMSYLSTRSEETESGETVTSLGDEDDEERDKALLAARRAQGRQKSLAAIERAMGRQAQADEEEIAHAEAQHEGIEGVFSPMEEEYKPLQTPAEVSIPIVGGEMGMGHGSSISGQSTPRTLGSRRNRSDMDSRSNLSHVTPALPQDPALAERTVEGSAEDVDDDVGNDTILEELVSQHDHGDGEGDNEGGLTHYSGESGGYDYAEEMEDGDGEGETTPQRLHPNHHRKEQSAPASSSPDRRRSLPRHLPQLNIDPRLSFGPIDPERERHILSTRSINGSFAASAISEGESEVGQVFEAVKRNVSIKVPSQLLPIDAQHGREDGEGLSVSPSKSDSLSTNFGPSPRHGSGQAYLSVNSIVSARRQSNNTPSPTRETRESSVGSRGSASRRGSAPNIHGLGMRRESTNPPNPSPLRPTVEEGGSSGSAARVIQKKSSFSFATPGSPLRIRPVGMSGAQSGHGAVGRPPLSPGLSPRTTQPGTFLSISPHAEPMARVPSSSSQLRNVVEPQLQTSPTPSTEDADHGPPGLAPSVASDSGSSDGHALESPPVMSFPTAITGRSPQLRSSTKSPEHPAYEYPNFAHGGVKHAAVSPSWQAPEHLLNPEVNYLHTTEMDHRLPVMSSARSARSIASHHSDDHSSMSHETSHSILLPGVRSKIAQLQSRDEALRKFSVASISSNNLPPLPPVSARPSIAHPTSHPMGASVSSASRSPVSRKSYTAALAPRPVRSSSDDAAPSSSRNNSRRNDDTLGGTTFIRPKIHHRDSSGAHANFFSGHLDPFGIGLANANGTGASAGGVKRQGSASSTSTTATSLDAALSLSGRTARVSMSGNRPGQGQGYAPVLALSPRQREEGREVMRPVSGWSGVTEETDESEGLR